MKLVRYSVLLLAAFLWLGGCSRDMMHFFYRTSIVQDEYRFGDLYRLSNLPQFKELQQPCGNQKAQPTTPANATGKSYNLFIIGDSFTEPQRIGKQSLTNEGIPVNSYHRTHWEDQKRIQLDTTQYNILLLESVERHFREHFAKAVTNLDVVEDTTQTLPATAQISWSRMLFDQIRSKGIEERLETTLFSQPVFEWLKEVKATLTLNWFDRWSPKVGLSTDRQHIFVDLDVDTTKRLNSSFAPLADSEINSLVDSVNATALRYKKAGFDAVYLSLIPNKVSILEPMRGPYNHLIERIQRHPRLQVPVIDVYSVYKNAKQPVYAISDSHWNCLGQRLWLQETKRCMRQDI